MAKPKRHSPEKITSILKMQESGLKVAEICRQAGIHEQTFYRWKSKYGGMNAAEVKRLKALEEENRKLKEIVGDQALAGPGHGASLAPERAPDNGQEAG